VDVNIFAFTSTSLHPGPSKFQDFSGPLTLISRTKIIFHDGPGLEDLQKKFQDFQEAWEPCIHYLPSSSQFDTSTDLYFLLMEAQGSEQLV